MQAELHKQERERRQERKQADILCRFLCLEMPKENWFVCLYFICGRHSGLRYGPFIVFVLSIGVDFGNFTYMRPPDRLICRGLARQVLGTSLLYLQRYVFLLKHKGGAGSVEKHRKNRPCSNILESAGPSRTRTWNGGRSSVTGSESSRRWTRRLRSSEGQTCFGTRQLHFGTLENIGTYWNLGQLKPIWVDAC